MKHIVICSDGTGNTAIKGRGTNVFKLFEAVDLNGHRTEPHLTPQIAFYDDGVGTETFKPLKVFAGMTGFGLSRNVRQLYKELCRVYDPEDRIFLFGFSRGAFTARTLAGLIASCGILDVKKLSTADELEAMVRRAYRAYRRRYRTVLAERLLGKPKTTETDDFRREHCLECPVPITFLGVWDTVDAVGLPFHLSDVINTTVYRFKFPDQRLSPAVQQACHALALDDERHSFHPLLWDETGDGQRIEQVWFAGAHSNIGGGYPKQGMSLVALDWMMARAEAAGLRFIETDRREYREHAHVDDKLYDSRAGLGVFYRWKPRDMAALCEENGTPPVLHLSVLERIAHGTEDYAPGNLAPGAAVAITPTGHPAKDQAAQERAREAATVLKRAEVAGRPLLAAVPRAIFVGRLSYYVYLVSCLFVVLAASAPDGWSSLAMPWALAEGAGALVGGLLTSPVATGLRVLRQLWATPTLLGALAVGFLLSYVMSSVADRRMSAVFSQFWHDRQSDLRAALKRARRAVLERPPLGSTPRGPSRGAVPASVSGGGGVGSPAA
jgi:uncharacterized protein (DUF2235 family)